MRTQLRPFQVDGVHQIEWFECRALLADEMGLGKGVQALSCIERNLPAGRTAIVVCAPGIRYNWQEETRKHCGIEAVVAETQRPYPIGRPRIVIIGYNLLDFWWGALRELNPYMIVADECQAIKERNSNRTRALAKLASGVPAFIATSGTPILNRPIEFWPVLFMLDPKYWGPFFPFAHRYGGPKKTSRGWTFTGASNVEELHKRLIETCMIRRRKEDVLKDLPPVMHNVVKLKLKDKDAKNYKEAETNTRAWLKDRKTKKVKAGAEELQRLSLLRGMVAEAKIEPVVDWIKEFLDSDEKLLAMGTSRAMTTGLHAKFKGAALANGDIQGEARQAEYNKFKYNPECPLLVGNHVAAGVGWSAEGCSNVAIVEHPWTPGELGQSIARCVGIGRGVEGIPTSVWHLVVPGTIDEMICAAVRRKQRILDQCLDGIQDSGSLSVLDDVIQGLLSK